jgi:predicted Zn-dependent peptidase
MAELEPKLNAALGAWKAPATASTVPAPAAPAQPKMPRVFLIDQQGAVQATIVVAQAVTPTSDPKALDLQIANSVLGGEFSSRLNMNLREAKHWAYGAYSGVGDAVGPRVWAASASVQIDRTIDSMKEFDREIREFASGKTPATAAELAKIQATEVRSLPGSYETGAAVIGTLSSMVLFGRPDDYPQKRAAAISALTTDKLKAAAATLTPAAMTWVVVGDLSKIEKGIRDLKLGDVKVIDADGKVVR